MNAELNLVIIGGSGKLGSELSKQVPQSLTPTHQELDITDYDQVREYMHRIKPSHVINTAAIVGMREAEADRDQTYKVNVLGALAVAQACSELNVRLVHIGSVAIFDGVKGFYREDDEPNPTYYYGQTKLQSEEVVQGSLDDYAIVRTDFFVPGSFKYKTVLTDYYCSKLPIGQLATRVHAIALSSFEGIINVGGRRDSLFNVLKPYAPDIEGITIAESALPNFPRDLSLDTSLFDTSFPEFGHQ